MKLQFKIDLDSHVGSSMVVDVSAGSLTQMDGAIGRLLTAWGLGLHRELEATPSVAGCSLHLRRGAIQL